MFSRLFCLLLLAVSTLPVVSAQPAVVGALTAYAIAPDPGLARRVGKVWQWEHSVAVPGATFLRLHIVNLNLEGTDTLELRDARGRLVETYRGRGPRQRGSFWTLSVPGERATLVWLMNGRRNDVAFQVDRIVTGDNRFDAARSVCGSADFDDAICVQPNNAQWANVQATAGVMLISGDPGEALFCTGVNISPDNRILTNHHCLYSQNLCDSAEFIFGYQRSSCNNGSAVSDDWLSYRCDEILTGQPLVDCEVTPGALDFVVASAAGEPSQSFGYVQPGTTTPASGEGLYIVQHPDGRPKEIAAGADTAVESLQLRYWGTLDTEPGSSGAPIFRSSDHQLVAIHHCGGCEDPVLGNRGVLMSAIAPLIDDHLCSPGLRLKPAQVEEPTELGVQPNGVAEPGEQWSFTPRILNSSCAADATAVMASFVVDPASAGIATLDVTQSVVGDIAAGASVAGDPVSFTIAPDAPCGAQLRISLSEIQSGSYSFPYDATQVALAIGIENVETPLFEDFSAGLPSDWSVVDLGEGGGPAQTWVASNPGSRPVALAEPFMIADSALHGDFFMDEELLSPVVDATGVTALAIEFRHDFSYVPDPPAEQADIDLRSSATGNNWINIANFSATSDSGHVQIDITPWAGTGLQLRWRYYNAQLDGWWAIDEVALVASTGFDCVTPGDTDADGVPDADDNCSVVKNAGQQDTDTDGVGNACDPDIAPQPNDCMVNFADLQALKAAFFSSPGNAGWNADADFNSDEVINFLDLQVLKTLFFSAPGPSGVVNICGS